MPERIPSYMLVWEMKVLGYEREVDGGRGGS